MPQLQKLLAILLIFQLLSIRYEKQWPALEAFLASLASIITTFSISTTHLEIPGKINAQSENYFLKNAKMANAKTGVTSSPTHKHCTKQRPNTSHLITKSFLLTLLDSMSNLGSWFLIPIRIFIAKFWLKPKSSKYPRLWPPYLIMISSNHSHFYSMQAMVELFFGNPVRRVAQGWNQVYQHYEDYWRFRLNNPGQSYRRYLRTQKRRRRPQNYQYAQSRQDTIVKDSQEKPESTLDGLFVQH